MMLEGWGRFPRLHSEVLGLRDLAGARQALAGRPSLIARGNGRAYGDAALSRHAVLCTLPSNRILAFDPIDGRITCEAGLLLADLLEFCVPHGFFPPVTPGTRYVTIGGMVAADVHGKNHHGAGSFGHHVEHMLILTADGQVRTASRTENPELFFATIGGMGLTGIALEITFRLLPIETAMIRQETRRAADLDAVLESFEQTAHWTYSVAWIDCLARGASMGRSLLFVGEHATAIEAPADALELPAGRQLRVPFDLPGFVLNGFTVRAFNALYYARGRPGTRIVSCLPYFYPLDALLDWNRIYGPAGFVQYQCVIPKPAGRAGLALLLERIAHAGLGSFLAVLKLFGAEKSGPLSFPMQGYTLALDFPARPAAFNLMLELDAVVADHGGRIYLAKDARAGAALLRRGYPELDSFMTVREAVDPNRKFASLQSERLGL
jgi:FAD/FMN-containing dehydrogenase